MRGSALLIGLLTSSGCDRVFQLDTIRDEASGDASSDSSPDAITVTFGETGDATYAGVTADTYLDAQVPTFNFGLDSRLVVDGGATAKIGLIRFDVSRLPGEAQIVSASIRLTTGTNGSAAPIAAMGMREGWEQGSLDGAPGPRTGRRRASAFRGRHPASAVARHQEPRQLHSRCV